jgi:hypothetical protein
MIRYIVEPTEITLDRIQREQISPYVGTFSDRAKSVETDLRSEALTGRLCHTQMRRETRTSGNTRHSAIQVASKICL